MELVEEFYAKVNDTVKQMSKCTFLFVIEAKIIL